MMAARMINILAASWLVLGIKRVATSSPPSSPLLKKFTSLVIFGDSYTDDGVHSYTPPVAAQGTNESTYGRVWPQYIQQYTGVNLYDYAHAGAVCNPAVSDAARSGVESDQFTYFLADNAFVSNVTGEPALINPWEQTVYAIWIGTNDLGEGCFLTETEPAGMRLTNYTDCVYRQLDRLHNIGARKFVLMNTPPLDLTPQYALPQNGGLNSTQLWPDKATYDQNITRTSEKMRQYLTMVNAVYEYQTPYEVLIAGRYPGSTIAIYDVHALITDIWNNPGKYLNGTVPYNVTSSVYRCGEPCDPLEVRDSYLWANDLHPSEQTDRIIAREFINVVEGTSKWARYWKKQ